MAEFDSTQNQINEDVFSEGGLYDFDIVVKSVDSFEIDLENPAYFKGSLSIPKKYDYKIESDHNVSITSFYDTIDTFSFSSESLHFSMPFVWSEENISQVSVVHEEIHVPKYLASWIASSYELKINQITAPNSLVTIDDYSIDDERIIHVIIPQKYLPDFAGDLQKKMNFEIKPNLSPDLPLSAPTRNSEYDVNLWWHPENLIWGDQIAFEIKIDDMFVANKVEEKIPFTVSLVQGNQILAEKTIYGLKNTDDSKQNIFEFTFDESHEGSIKLLVENIDSNTYANTEFAFVVNAPTLKFPITIPSQKIDRTEGRYDVDITWIPADLIPDEESEFIFTIYEKDTKIPVFDAYYEFAIMQNGEDILRRQGIASAGGYYEDVIFSEDNSGQVIVKLDKINNSDEYAEISVNVVPEFGPISILILTVSVIAMLLATKKYTFKATGF